MFVAALLFPAIVFTGWTITGSVLRARGAANAVPLITVAALVGLWLGISLPLVLLGASYGFRIPPVEHPVKVQRLERQIPPQRWYMTPWVLFIVPGIVPFGAAFIELRFILSSLWQGMVYYVFGFLSMVFVVVLITTVLTTVVIIYYQLVYEDYRWWWPSVFIPGGMGLHFFLYSVHYFLTVLQLRTWLACAIFFQFSLFVSLAISLAFGTIGFLAAWAFVRQIYASVKVE